MRERADATSIEAVGGARSTASTATSTRQPAVQLAGGGDRAPPVNDTTLASACTPRSVRPATVRSAPDDIPQHALHRRAAPAAAPTRGSRCRHRRRWRAWRPPSLDDWRTTRRRARTGAAVRRTPTPGPRPMIAYPVAPSSRHQTRWRIVRPSSVQAYVWRTAGRPATVVSRSSTRSTPSSPARIGGVLHGRVAGQRHDPGQIVTGDDQRRRAGAGVGADVGEDGAVDPARGQLDRGVHELGR